MTKALRNIERLAGKSYKAGDAIPDAVIQSMSAQVVRALVESHTIEVPGMEAKAGGMGGNAHMQARLDKQSEQIKKLELGRAEDAKSMSALVGRLEALEGKKPAKVIAAPKAPTAKV